jgi:hypothetical protein
VLDCVSISGHGYLARLTRSFTVFPKTNGDSHNFSSRQAFTAKKPEKGDKKPFPQAVIAARMFPSFRKSPRKDKGNPGESRQDDARESILVRFRTLGHAYWLAPS